MKHVLSPFAFVLLIPCLAFSQDTSRPPVSPLPLHVIDARTPDALRALFRFDGDPMPLVSAHRGGAQAGFPENCIATFENTIRHTYSLLEIDLRYSKDGKIVLHHDPSLERTTTGKGPVAEQTLRDLKTLRLNDLEGKPTEYQIPTLDEALEWARGKTVLVLDKKDVPVDVCVRKIEEHQAEAYAMVMAYNFKEVKECYNLNRNIMMEIMIGNRERFRQFDETGVPWTNVIVFVSHSPPEDLELLQMIHGKGACCMAGTSRNLDKQLRNGRDTVILQRAYRDLLKKGVDVIETDLPIQVGSLLYSDAAIPASKSPYFSGR